MFSLLTGVALVAGNAFSLLNGYLQSRRLARYRKVIRVLYGLGIGYGAARILTVIAPSWYPLSWYLLLLVAAGAGSVIWRTVGVWLADRLTGAAACLHYCLSASCWLPC